MQKDNQINLDQHELFEEAQKRIRQKKHLFLHFWVYVLGCVFMFVINRLLNYGINYNWYIWGILLWTFLFLLHVVNVFVVNRFMGKEWERKQRERLLAIQQKKILKMEVAIEKEFQKQKEKVAEELSNESTSQQNIT